MHPRTIYPKTREGYTYRLRNLGVKSMKATSPGRLFHYLTATLFVAYLLLIPRVFNSLPPVGDEPEYLRTTESILADRDLDLSNNPDYRARPGERAGFTADDSRHILFRPGGSALPPHNIGYPLLMLPAYALGGRLGAMILTALLAALAAGNLALLAKEVSGEDSPAATVAAAAGLTVPCFFYAFQLYPAAPTLLFQVYLVRKLLAGDRATRAELLLGGAALALLPWMHYRYVLLALCLPPVLFIFLGWRSARRHILFFAPSAISFFILFVFQKAVFGSFAFLEVESGNIVWQLKGFLGLLLDQEFGLLVYAPFYFLCPAALAIMAKERRREVFFLLFVFAFHFVQFALLEIWWGGWSPAGRRMVEYLPLLVPALAFAIGRRGSAAFRLVFAVLVFVSLAAAFATIANPWHLFINEGHGANKLFQIYGSLGWMKAVFPSLMLAGARDYLLTAAWLGFFCAVNFALMRNASKRKSPGADQA